MCYIHYCIAWQLHSLSLNGEKCPKVVSHTWQNGGRDNGTLGQLLGQFVRQVSNRQYAQTRHLETVCVILLCTAISEKTIIDLHIPLE